jgi:hypothetical protein
MRLMEKCYKGFNFVIKAETENELQQKKQEIELTFSELRREKKLGTYRKNKSWVRIKEYSKNSFTVEKGYELSLTFCENFSHEETTKIIDDITSRDFVKEGMPVKQQSSAVDFDPSWLN